MRYSQLDSVIANRDRSDHKGQDNRDDKRPHCDGRSVGKILKPAPHDEIGKGRRDQETDKNEAAEFFGEKE